MDCTSTNSWRRKFGGSDEDSAVGWTCKILFTITSSQVISQKKMERTNGEGMRLTSGPGCRKSQKRSCINFSAIEITSEDHSKVEIVMGDSGKEHVMNLSHMNNEDMLTRSPYHCFCPFQKIHHSVQHQPTYLIYHQLHP